MSITISLLLAIPLGAAALTLLTPQLWLRRGLSLTASTASLVISLIVLLGVDAGGTEVVAVGGWEAPLGITLVADRFAALMLSVSSAALLGVVVFAVGQRNNDRQFSAFHAVYQTLAAGVMLAFLTGDLFTLFVAFEIMLTASYVLITHRAGTEQVRATMTYVVVGLVASGLFLVAIGLLYAATGTVNLADLSLRLESIDPALRTAAGWLLFMVFGIKAAIFPLFFWLPDSYPTAVTPVTAIFAGLLTKVGVYAMIRTQTLLFPGDGPSTTILVIAGLTMVIGVLGAIAQGDIKRILSFHIISQIGYMIMGLGFFTVAGIAAAIVFIVHQIVVKTVMFLVGGLVEAASGTGRLKDVAGVLHRFPIVALLFLPAALSLAGLPPFSGFVGKLALVQAGFDAGRWVIVGVSLFASVLTLFSMTKIWSGAFWGTPTSNLERAPARSMVAATAGLVALSVLIGLAGQPLLEIATRAAGDGGGRRIMIAATNLAFALFAVGAAMAVYRLSRGPSLADRMVALDTLLFIGAAALGTYVVRTGETVFVPVVVVIALVAFIGTLVVARTIEHESAS
jgi:multicomponent Na+:H+ antiporter subunit D